MPELRSVQARHTTLSYAQNNFFRAHAQVLWNAADYADTDAGGEVDGEKLFCSQDQ